MNASKPRGKHLGKIFLSHSHADSDRAREIRDLLVQRLGFQVFSNGDLSAGEKWQAKLQKELEGADIFVALLTPQSRTDPWVLQETGAAWSLHKTIIPLVTQYSILDRFPVQFRNGQALEMKDLETPDGLKQFTAALERSLAQSLPV